MQQRGGDQRHSAIDGDQRRVRDLAVQKQYLGQAGRGHLEHARHARGGKGIPEPDPPRPPNPQGAHQQDGTGEHTVAGHIVVGKVRIQSRIQQGGQQRGEQQGGQLSHHPPAPRVHNHKQVGHQDGVGDQGKCKLKQIILQVEHGEPHSFPQNSAQAIYHIRGGLSME